MRKAIVITLLAIGIGKANAIFMDDVYAKMLCDAWNKTPQLVDNLGKSESWSQIAERKLFLYREDCPNSKQIQLTIRNEDSKARCIYGGFAKDQRSKDDFLMYAHTSRWLEMGAKAYGPMKAMMTNRLKFEGPRGVAMKNMGPFEAFLDLIDQQSDSSKCP